MIQRVMTIHNENHTVMQAILDGDTDSIIGNIMI